MPSKVLLKSRLAHVELGRQVSNDDIDLLISGEADVFKPDGRRLCSVRRGVISSDNRDVAREVLRPLRNRKSSNRGLASGTPRRARVRVDGSISNTNISDPVASSIIGYFDRYPRIPYCRQTSFNAEHEDEFDRIRPALGELAACFRDTVSDRYAAQMERVLKTSPDFIIGGTPWTTITVNHNWATATHTDKGDLDEGFSCLTVLRQGDYQGGVLCFPAFRVGVDLYDGDLIMMDAHEIHSNTPILDDSSQTHPGPEPERISMVLYYRTGMLECGSAAEEQERAKARGAIDLEEEGA